MAAIQELTLDVGGAQIFTWHKQAPNPRSDALTLVILHGAGKSYSERFMSIAQHFLEVGVSVIGLDFVGHGKTGGQTVSSSLDLRNKHALAAIKEFAPNNSLVLLGSSMGGHNALRLTEVLGDRVQGLCLLQPALYAKDAEQVLFTEAFTKILREPGSWRSSLALYDAKGFEGRVFIGIGSEDVVIPWGVIEALAGAFRASASTFRLEIFRGAGHDLPEWLPERSTVCKQVVEFLTKED